MKKLILILMVSSLFGDTIIKEKETEDDDGYITKIKEEIECSYYGIHDSSIYYKPYKGLMKNIACSEVISIIVKDKELVFDCSENTFTPNFLLLSGLQLNQFSKKYYNGYLLTVVGNVLFFMNANSGNEGLMVIGGGSSLIGGIMMLTSFTHINKAGDNLIKAAEQSEKENN